jgi:hypothetical protein
VTVSPAQSAPLPALAGRLLAARAAATLHITAACMWGVRAGRAAQHGPAGSLDTRRPVQLCRALVEQPVT